LFDPHAPPTTVELDHDVSIVALEDSHRDPATFVLRQ
jgi:hypothetical protein